MWYQSLGALDLGSQGLFRCRVHEEKKIEFSVFGFIEDDQHGVHSLKDAKLLMEAIEKRYGGNKESKKFQRTLLKQQYENFAGLSSETMDQTFDSTNNNSIANEVDNTAYGVSGVKAYAALKDQYDSLSSAYKSLKLELGYNAASSTAASPAVESFVNSSEMLENQENNKSKADKGYHAVPPPFTGNFIPFKPDLTFMDEIVKSENMDVTTIVTPSVESYEILLNKMITPHPNRRFVPQVVLTKSGKINIAGASVNTAIRPVNIAGSKLTVNHPRPIANAYKKGYSQVTRPFNKYSEYKNNIFNKKVNTARVKDTTARDRAVVSENKGKGVNVVKASACWVWKAKNSSNPQQKEYKEKGVIDSGLLLRPHDWKQNVSMNYKDYDGGFVSFGDGKGRISRKGKIKTGTLDFNNLLDESQVLLRVPRKDNIYSVDLKSVVPTKCLTYLFAKAIIVESNLWHRRLGHINIKNINKLVKGNLNGVAERRNRTLIEAARTMLVDSKLPTTFWAKAVNTACYVLNRVLVIKPHNKTPYELIRGRTPLIDFMKPFGCLVTILNTRDHLGKFDGKADEILEGQPKLGLWYPRDSPFDLEAFFDSDYAGASLDRKSTIGGLTAATVAAAHCGLFACNVVRLMLQPGVKYYEVLEDASKQGRTDDKTKKMFTDSDFDELDNDIENVEGETVNTATTGVSTVSAPVTTAGIAISTAEPRTPPTTAATIFGDEDLTIAQTLVKMRSEKAKEKEKGVAFRDEEEPPRLNRATTTLQPLPTIDPKDKGKGVLVEEPKKLEKVKRRDQGLAQIESDAELAQRLHKEELAEIDVDHELAVRLTNEEQEKYTIEERARLLAELFDRRKKQLAAERAEAIRNKPPTRTQVKNRMITYLKHMGKYTHQQLKYKNFEEVQKLYEREKKWIDDFKPIDDDSQQQAESTKKRPRADSEEESSKKQKLEEDNDAEKEYLRDSIDVSPKDDVAIDVESLATKYPIGYWKTHILNENMMYYQIIRADGSSKNYKIFSEMLDDFDRQDVIDLHRLDYNWIRWRLFDSCGVHVLLMNTGVAIHMMIEKKYPLTQEMLSRMLNRRLEVDYESEMAFELLKFTRSQLQNLGEDCWELKASEVTTVSFGSVVRFGKKEKLAPRFVGPFEITERIGPVAYRLRLSEELNGVHDMSNIKKCLVDPSLQIPLDEIQVNSKLNFMEESVEVLDREFKKLRQSRIPIVKVRWNSKRGIEFTWECEDQMKLKYPHLFSSSTS
ncbi:ribonuclease H-like domain-containing protein [Tanacetum coccineum]